MIFLEKILQNT